MPVLVKTKLQSGTGVTIETVFFGGNATVQITYDRQPTTEDRNEVSRMVGAVMREFDLVEDVTITQRSVPQT